MKLFWLLALVDYQTLKALVEFRSELDNINITNETTVAGWKTQTPALTGTCRYCGKQNNTGLLAIGNVCADQECQVSLLTRYLVELMFRGLIFTNIIHFRI